MDKAITKINPTGQPMNEDIASVPTARILYANRAPSEAYSIEGLFHSIARALPKGLDAQTVAAPKRRANLKSVFTNLKWAAGLGDVELVHITGDIHYAAIGVRQCPVVLTIHDLRFIEEARGLKRFLFWWWWLYLPCLQANRVTVISEFTKSRLLALCRVNPKKLRVIPNCVAPEFTPRPKLWPDGKPQLLQVGTGDNKNLGRVIKACAGLPIQLSILGELTTAQRQQLDQQGAAYEEFCDLSKDEVVALYAASDLVIFVSTYEGFGLPILEAQAIGRPVLTSDLSPMREVAGGGALLVDPLNKEDIRSGLLRLIEDADLRKELVSAGLRNVRQYSASAIATKYAALYREVVDR